jgi:hypothetical protein
MPPSFRFAIKDNNTTYNGVPVLSLLNPDTTPTTEPNIEPKRGLH